MESRRRPVPFLRCLGVSWVLHGTALAAVGVLAGWWMHTPQPGTVSLRVAQAAVVPAPPYEEPTDRPEVVPPAEPQLEPEVAPVQDEVVPLSELPTLAPLPVDILPRWDHLDRDFEPQLKTVAAEPEPVQEPVPAVEPESAEELPVEAASEVETAFLLEGPAPRYPLRSVWNGEKGTVLCRLYLEPDGSVSRVEVVESSGFARLDAAAVEALLQWKFRPPSQGEAPLPPEILHPVTFRFEDR